MTAVEMILAIFLHWQAVGRDARQSQNGQVFNPEF